MYLAGLGCCDEGGFESWAKTRFSLAIPGGSADPPAGEKFSDEGAHAAKVETTKMASKFGRIIWISPMRRRSPTVSTSNGRKRSEKRQTA
jgi:hypothetical protein